MKQHQPDLDVRTLAQEILGYLNFSSGAADVKFLKNLSDLFGILDRPSEKNSPTWRRLGDFLREQLAVLHGESDAFRAVEQAEAVLRLLFDAALPAYREFHRDLLFHQTDEQLFQPFFIGRVCEAVLRQGGPWDETERIVRGAIARLNDYLGHRPVAVLRTEQKIQPYDHEWVRPIPLWIRGAGVAHGPVSRTGRDGPGDPRRHRSGSFCSTPLRPGTTRRAGVRPAGVRLRPSGEQAAELPLRPMGHEQAGQRRPLPPLRVAAGDARRHARPPARPRPAAAQGGALRGGGRAGRHDADGLGRQRQPARRPRFDRHAGHAGAEDRRLSRRLLRAAARTA